MNRHAFLIGSPQIEGKQGFLRGVTPDINNMKRHLLSDKGGAWIENTEITVFSNPTREELFSKITGTYDYVFIQYSGHGFQRKNNDVRFFLSPYEDIGLAELTSNIIVSKRFFFIDCCRGIEEEDSRAVESGIICFSERINPSREKFNRAINCCEEGTSIIYSCSKNQSASEDDDGLGGIFTLSYLRTANDLNPNKDKYSSIKTVFDLAVDKMKKDYPLEHQTPEIKPERRNRYFPFVV